MQLKVLKYSCEIAFDMIRIQDSLWKKLINTKFHNIAYSAIYNALMNILLSYKHRELAHVDFLIEIKIE